MVLKRSNYFQAAQPIPSSTPIPNETTKGWPQPFFSVLPHNLIYSGPELHLRGAVQYQSDLHREEVEFPSLEASRDAQSQGWAAPGGAQIPLGQSLGLVTSPQISFLTMHGPQTTGFLPGKGGIGSSGCNIPAQTAPTKTKTRGEQSFVPPAGSGCLGMWSWAMTHNLCPSALLPSLFQNHRAFKQQNYFVFFSLPAANG